MHLRVTELQDEAAVTRVLLAAYGQLLTKDYPAETLAVVVPLISRAKPELLTSGTYYAVEDAGSIIAVGGWTRTQPGTNAVIDHVGHIRHVATDPKHLRKGAAGMIMQHCLTTARNSGMNEMECLSTRTAEPFYARCGFKRAAERDVVIAGFPFPSVEMRMLL
jgi:N-acetylglutamate synthase-like GNAT family acetyltransferase